MDFTNLHLLIVLFLASAPILSLPTLFVASWWYNIVTRSNITLADCFTNWWAKRVPEPLFAIIMVSSFLACLFFLPGLVLFFNHPVKLSEVLFHLPLSFIGVPALAVVSPFIARFVVDLCRGLKWDKNTGKLGEVEELRKKIEKLERGG